MAAAAAMHVDGRLRERAVRALARRDGPIPSAVLALRLLDHVPEVASAALEVVAGHSTGLEADLVADVLLHGADRQAAAGRWAELVDTLVLDTSPVLDWLRTSRYRKARRWAVEESLRQCLLDNDTVLRVASTDPDQWLRRAAAVRTFAARVPGQQTIQTLAPRLNDPSGRVSGTAATVLTRAGASSSVAEQAWQSPRSTARRAAWRVSRAAGGWTRVSADLRAATDADLGLAGLGRDSLQGWLVDGAATTWGRPNSKDAVTMAERLPAAGLSDADAERIAFHAGLPFTRRRITAKPSPDPSNSLPRPRNRIWRNLRRHTR